MGDNILISTAVATTPLPDLIYRPDTDRYLVAWQQGGNIYSRGVLPNGTVAGGATAVANTSQLETYPCLAADASGALLIWQRQNTGSGYDVYARPLDTNGLPNGEAFVIQETTGNQQNPTIVYGANGRYQLAWQDDATGPWDLFTSSLDRSYQVTHIEYEYDPLYRLTSADYSGDLAGTYAYEYDAVGNRTVYTATITNTAVTIYTYNAANQLITAKASNSPDTWYYEYDENGNQVRQVPNGLTPAAGEIRYTFDQRNHLNLVEKHSGSGYEVEATATYDGDGNRLQTTVYASGNPVTITYTVDVQLRGIPLVLHQPAEADIFVIPGLGEYQDNWNYYLMDVQMSVRQLVDDTGTVLLTRTYDPSGSILESSGTGDSVFGFVGTQNGALGLLYFDGQYYDPTTGRYLSPDYSHFNPLHPSQGTNGYLAANLLANPSGLLLGPLLILSWRKRRKGSKNPGMWLLAAGIGIGVLTVGCQSVPGTPTSQVPPPTQATAPTTSLDSTTPPTQPPTATVVGEPPALTAVPTSTPMPSATPSIAGVIPGPNYNNVYQYLADIRAMTTAEGIPLGYNACGLVAAAHGVGGDDNWQ